MLSLDAFRLSRTFAGGRHRAGLPYAVIPTRLEAAAILARRGVFRPARPDRMLRQGLTVLRWGSTIAAAYIAGAQGDPDRAALVDDAGELSYGDIDSRTNALARGLSAAGLREGDRLGLLSRNGRAFLEAVVASAKLGADVLLLNTSFSRSELRAVLERDRPRLLVHDGEFEPLVQEAAPRMERVLGHVEDASSSLPTLEQLVERGPAGGLQPPAREGRTVILTSGTTGTPKGARLSRPPNLEPLAWLLSAIPLEPRSPYLVCAPLFHAHGYGQLLSGAGLGCTLLLSRRFDPERTLALIDRHRVVELAAVPIMLKRLLDLPAAVRGRYDTGSLKVVLSSGSALSGDLATRFMDEFGPVLYNLYGSTEIAAATVAGPGDLRAAPGTVGRPPPHTRLAVLDRDGQPVAPGETGRIFVGHELLFEGYTSADRHELTDGMMTAGDLGHLDEDGRLFVDSREDDMIVSGGENVYPTEVEEVLGGHPDLEEVAVIGVPDEEFGERLVAFAVPRHGASTSPDDILRYARERLARYKMPRQVELREQLPRNALGKVLKRELRTSSRPTEAKPL